MGGRSPPGHTVKLPVRLYAEAVIMAEARGRTVGQWVELAVQAQLERDQHSLKVSRFAAASREAAQNRRPGPQAQDFGLPHDYGIPPGLR